MNHKIKDNLFATAITATVIALVIVLNVVLYYLSAINGWYIANAEELDLSLSGSTEELFAEAEENGRRNCEQRHETKRLGQVLRNGIPLI